MCTCALLFVLRSKIHVRCLVLLAEHLQEDGLVQAIPTLFPTLLKLLQNPSLPIKAQIRCLTVYRILCSSIPTLRSQFKGKKYAEIVQKLLAPTFPQFMELVVCW